MFDTEDDLEVKEMITPAQKYKEDYWYWTVRASSPADQQLLMQGGTPIQALLEEAQEAAELFSGTLLPGHPEATSELVRITRAKVNALCYYGFFTHYVLTTHPHRSKYDKIDIAALGFAWKTAIPNVRSLLQPYYRNAGQFPSMVFNMYYERVLKHIVKKLWKGWREMRKNKKRLRLSFDGGVLLGMMCDIEASKVPTPRGTLSEKPKVPDRHNLAEPAQEGVSPSENVSSRTLNDEQAARLFVSTTITKVNKSWDGLVAQIRAEPAWAKSLIFGDEEKAKWDLLVAVMSMDLVSLDQLFPEQAERLYKLTIATIPEKEREYVREAIEEYTSRFREDIEQGLNPMLAIGEILYGRWGLAGDSYKPKELFIAPDQLLAHGLSVIITSLLGTWKKIHQNFQLVT